MATQSINFSASALPIPGNFIHAADVNTTLLALINDYNLPIGSNKIATGAIVYSLLSNDSSWASITFTPVLTNITLGNGTVSCRYIQIGKTVIGRTQLVFGSTTSISGGFLLSMPVTANTTIVTAVDGKIGRGVCLETGSQSVPCDVHLVTSTTLEVRPLQTGSLSGYVTTDVPASATVPFTWSTGHVLEFDFIYEAA